MKSIAKNDRTFQGSLGTSLSFVSSPTPEMSLASVREAATAAQRPPPIIALSFSNLKYCCSSSMMDGSEFDRFVAATPPPIRTKANKSMKSEKENVTTRNGNSSNRAIFVNSIAEKTHRKRLETNNLIQRRNMNPLSPIFIAPPSPNYDGWGQRDDIHIKSSTNARAITLKQSLSLALSSEAQSTKAIKRTTSSNETKMSKTVDVKDKSVFNLPLTKHEGYDAAMEVYKRRYANSSIAVCETENETQSSLAAKSSWNSRSEQNEGTLGTKPTKANLTGSYSFSHRVSQRRVEVIEMQKRKSRSKSLSLSRTALESSSIAAVDGVKRQEKVNTREDGNDNVVGSSTTSKSIYRMPPVTQANQRMVVNSAKTTTTSNRQRSISSMPLDQVSTSKLSRVEIRKARAREGRHRRVT